MLCVGEVDQMVMHVCSWLIKGRRNRSDRLHRVKPEDVRVVE